MITDGLPAYAYMVPGAKHTLCRFHHQQGVTQWLQQHFYDVRRDRRLEAGHEKGVADPG
jgi:hypothetical protein